MFNAAMAKSRVTIELFFGEVRRYRTYIDLNRAMRIKESAVVTIYIATVLLTNARHCIHTNTIVQYFK